jgi:chromosome segregation ATPase
LLALDIEIFGGCIRVPVRSRFILTKQEKQIEWEQSRLSRQRKLVKEEDARIQKQRDQAMKALEDARKTEADLAGQIDDALAKIASNTDRLVLAEEKIMRVTAELGKLGDKSLELVRLASHHARRAGYLCGSRHQHTFQESVLEILEGSIRELVKLKADVEKLVVLFHNILVEVQDTAKGQLEGFLDPIRKAITEGAEPNTVDTLDIRKGSKKVRNLGLALRPSNDI